ncbi:MAG TPA: TetR/AcrR family transcriptional regulator [Atopostipes sp.]|nr:TetR/AcrR family transcriptional regulator [Atopostipes sp.]
MPKQTFYNLPEEKRERLIDAAIDEFTIHSLREASITNIIKQAEIPRGSFYQYFEDLDDLFFYLIKRFVINLSELTLSIFEETEGDFQRVTVAYAETYIDFVMNSEKSSFYKVIYLNMNSRVKRKIFNAIIQSFKDSPAISNKFDLNSSLNLKFENTTEHIDLIRLILGMLNQTISEGFSEDWTTETTKELFNKRLDWVSYGVINA